MSVTYRIIEEKRPLSGTSKFYIERLRSLLIFWEYWDKLTTVSNYPYHYEFVLDFDDYESAKSHFDYLVEKIEVIVHDTNNN